MAYARNTSGILEYHVRCIPPLADSGVSRLSEEDDLGLHETALLRPKLLPALLFRIWEFPKITVTIFWGPYNKGPTI